jgi:hypothetical protein
MFHCVHEYWMGMYWREVKKKPVGLSASETHPTIDQINDGLEYYAASAGIGLSETCGFGVMEYIADLVFGIWAMGISQFETWNWNWKFDIWNNGIYCEFEFVFGCGECRDDDQELVEFGTWNLDLI